MKPKAPSPTPSALVSVTDAVAAQIAEEASADIRSVWKRLAGGTLKPKVQERIDRAIAARAEAPEKRA